MSRTNQEILEEYTDKRWRELQRGTAEVLRQHVNKVAEIATLEYLYSLEDGNRQEIIASMVGHHEHYDDKHRILRLVLTKDGAKKLKDIGKDFQITFNGKALDFKKPRQLPAKMALHLYHEYGPVAEDRAKRDVLMEVVDEEDQAEEAAA